MKHRQLGAFTIEGELGRGGMGVVYRGKHADGTPVAVKVVAAKYARTERRRLEFRREVHAMARLNHPNIATIFDTGMTGQGDGARPWYAMELIEGAPLSRSALTGDWHQLKGLLLGLLDALAYAHARDLIHRDIKPGNVLVSYSDDDLQATLVDFGIAHALYRDDEVDAVDTEFVTGTPNYMAPEQVTGQWRDQGPWTDLYAVGCMVWRLVTGHPPFGRDTQEQVLRAQLHEELPAFEPRFDVPDSLEDWLRTLLEKSPRRRFRRAADAAFALLRMPVATSPASPGRSAATSKVARTFATEQLSALATLADTIVDDTAPLIEQPRAQPEGQPCLPSRTLPPLPPNWKRISAAIAPKQITGAGLGLFGLREIPVVGREMTRRMMWETLRHVRTEKRAQTIVLRGPTGCGKTRLFRWLARRAHEAGSAIVLEARHTPFGGPLDGLGAMLQRFFRANGLAHDETFERVQRFYRQQTSLDEEVAFYDAVVLTQVMATGQTSPGETSPSGASIDEQLDVVAQFLIALAAQRPVILAVDDAQWAGQTLEVVRQVLMAHPSQPAALLAVVTLRDDASERSAYANEQLSELLEDPASQLVDLGPLKREVQRTLVNHLLSLSEETVEHVVERAQGDPLFAIQLLDDWIDQGELTATPDGFMPTAPFDEALPQSPMELWRRRVDHLVGALSPHRREQARGALEGAALLGQHIDMHEWRALAERVGFRAPDALVDEMVARNLASASLAGWSFRHKGLRDGLSEIACRTGRLTARHRLCAEVLEELYGSTHLESTIRIVRHRHAAGDEQYALSLLFRVLETVVYNAPLCEAIELLTLAEHLLDRLDVPHIAPQRCILEGYWCGYFRRTREVDKAMERVDRAIAMATDNHWTEEAIFAHALKGMLLKELGRLNEVQHWIDRALQYADAKSNRHTLARAIAVLGSSLLSQGRIEESMSYLRRALRICKDEDEVLTLRIEAFLGYGEFMRGNHERAQEILIETRDALRQKGQRRLSTVPINDLGDVARHQGRWDEALAHYRQAAQLSQGFRTHGSLAVKINIALVSIGQDCWTDAQKTFEEILGETSGDMLPHLQLALAGCAAHRGDLQEATEHLEQALAQIRAAHMADKDLAWLGEKVARKAAQCGWPHGATQLRHLALEQYEILGDEVSLGRVADALN